MSKVYPQLDEFTKFAQSHNVVPVVTEIGADIETPISVFMKLCGEKENAVLLESHLGGENFGKYSFICFNPLALFQIKGNVMKQRQRGRKDVVKVVADPLEYLKTYLAEFKQARIPGLPDFAGGLVGYIGHEMVRFCDDVKIFTKKKSGFADAIMMQTGIIVAFDNQKNKIQIINNVVLSSRSGLRKAYMRGVRENEAVIEKMRSVGLAHDRVAFTKAGDFQKPESNYAKAEFIAAVKRAKEYIAAGDVIQVVLSQKFTAKIKGNTLNLYRVLRDINPSRYMFYLNFGQTKLVGSSPEILVKLSGEEITLRPIAGTIKRTQNNNADKLSAKELRRDPKERAEHIMLLDLGRNDVGRVAQTGTVRVTECMKIEKFSHVMHMVSNVIGKIKKGLGAFDVFRACFPQGTLTGAPKIRAMEIINELEPSERGPYGGMVGYFGYNGDMDSCIVIRTITILGDQAVIQVGAGIVADSDPEKEYAETLAKSKGSTEALTIFMNGGEYEKKD